MMVIHLTKKLQSKLHAPVVAQEHIETSPHLRWYANLFTADRSQYILTTNAASLFSVVLPKRGLTHDGVYIARFLDALREHMEDAGFELIYQRCVAPYTGAITLAKSEDRSVMGSMNDIINTCTFMLEDGDISVYGLSREINTTIFTSIAG